MTVTEPGDVFYFNTGSSDPIQFAPGAQAVSYVVTAESYLGDDPAQYEVDSEISTQMFIQTEFPSLSTPTPTSTSESTTAPTPTPTIPELPIITVIVLMMASALAVLFRKKTTFHL